MSAPVVALLALVACGGADAPSRPTDTEQPLEIVFAHETVAGQEASSQLFLASADGTTIRPFDVIPNENTEPAWSPDGRLLAFTNMFAPTLVSVVGLVDSEGAGLVPFFPPGTSWAPAWSPDGEWLVYLHRDFDENFIEVQGLAVSHTDASDLHWLSPAAMGDSIEGPATWSPDGRIAFTIRDAGGAARIWTVNADGTSPAPLTSGPGDSRPRWSPDGTRVAFVQTTSPSAGVTDHDVVVADADGTGRQVLVGSGDDDRPSWSPDGQWILFERTDVAAGQPRCTLYKVAASGGTPVALGVTAGPGRCVGSSWRDVP